MGSFCSTHNGSCQPFINTSSCPEVKPCWFKSLWHVPLCPHLNSVNILLSCGGLVLFFDGIHSDLNKINASSAKDVERPGVRFVCLWSLACAKRSLILVYLSSVDWIFVLPVADATETWHPGHAHPLVALPWGCANHRWKLTLKSLLRSSLTQGKARKNSLWSSGSKTIFCNRWAARDYTSFQPSCFLRNVIIIFFFFCWSSVRLAILDTQRVKMCAVRSWAITWHLLFIMLMITMNAILSFEAHFSLKFCGILLVQFNKDITRT